MCPRIVLYCFKVSYVLWEELCQELIESFDAVHVILVEQLL
jgi:hypothetical protein